MARMFGTDGVRGIANTAELSVELAVKLGRAAAHVLGQAESTQRSPDGTGRLAIVMGRDTRRSGDMLGSALAAGMMSAGLDVIDIGMAPTPAVAYLAPALGAVAGAVISASHNPAEHNGIKFFGADGFKLTDAMEDDIARYVTDDAASLPPLPTGTGIGRCQHRGEALVQYCAHVAAAVPRLQRRWKIVVDCAHGAAVAVAAEVYERLGADVIVIGGEPDGDNINDGYGSTHPDALQVAVVAHGADLGIAHDGDADRVLLVDEHGNVVDGDAMLYMCGRHLHEQGQLPHATVVATVMSNLGLEVGLRELGIALKRTAVGDRYVLEELRAGGYALGGEQSGHVIFLEHSTTGDGIMTAAQILHMLDAREVSLGTLAAQMPRYPQRLINVPVADRNAFKHSQTAAEAIAAAEQELGDRGRVLVRPSGTESIVRVMVEAVEADRCEAVAERLAAIIEQALGNK